MERLLAHALEEARATGRIEHPDPRALARFLVVVVQGLQVVGMALPDRAFLEDAIDPALAAVGVSAA